MELANLSCHYPESGHTPKTLKVISVDWFEAFGRLNDFQFKELVKEAKMKCGFFPKIADISESAKVLANKKPGDEFLFCGFCEGSILDCDEMKSNEQMACNSFTYHAASPLGLKRLERERGAMFCRS